MLSENFFGLTAYARQAIRGALGSNASDGSSFGFSSVVNVEATSEVISPPQEPDSRLPKVCEALVLITQCIVTITLEEEEDHSHASERDDNNVNRSKTFYNEARSDGGDGLIESLLGFPIISILYLHTHTRSNRPPPSTRSFPSADQLRETSCTEP
jgi:ataxin-10